MEIKTTKLKYIHLLSKKVIPKQRNDYDCGMIVFGKKKPLQFFTYCHHALQVEPTFRYFSDK